MQDERPSQRLRAAVVGARSVRQGTGPYIARELRNAGCDVTAIVGTSPISVAQAKRRLAQSYGIDCRGYLSLSELLQHEPVDLVAITSPAPTHLELVREALHAGRHVLCEKPLWWPQARAASEYPAERIRQISAELADQASRSGCLLALNTQWPYTLRTFRQLHPATLVDGTAPSRFEMWLSPTGQGPGMVADSASHLISMLQALAGGGEMEDIEITWGDHPGGAHLTLRFTYRHERGTLRTVLRLDRCAEAPRPAGYSIDGHPVERRVILPQYALFLEYNRTRIALHDPLADCVAEIVEAVHAGTPTHRERLVSGMVQLHELVSATEITC